MDAAPTLTNMLRKAGQTPNTSPTGKRTPSPSKRGHEKLLLTKRSKVSKPFTIMDLEELLECLPDLSRATIVELWIPALHNHLNKAKLLLLSVIELSRHDNKAITAQLAEFSDLVTQLKSISSTFSRSVEAGQSLSERDTKESHFHLKEAEARIDTVVDAMNDRERKILEQAREIALLKSAYRERVAALGNFIQTNLPVQTHGADPEATQGVLDIIKDNEHENTVVTKNLDPDPTQTVFDLRDKQLENAEQATVIKRQTSMIGEQSEALDEMLEKLTKATTMVKERDNMIGRLIDDISSLESQVTNQVKLRSDNNSKDEMILQQMNKIGLMRASIENMRLAHEVDIAQRDKEIQTLTEKLGSVQQDALAAKQAMENAREDVRNVITHTQAMMAPAGNAKSSHAQKALRFLGIESSRSATKKFISPLSPSLSLSTSALQSETQSKFAADAQGSSANPSALSAFGSLVRAAGRPFPAIPIPPSSKLSAPLPSNISSPLRRASSVRQASTAFTKPRPAPRPRPLSMIAPVAHSDTQNHGAPLSNIAEDPVTSPRKASSESVELSAEDIEAMHHSLQALKVLDKRAKLEAEAQRSREPAAEGDDGQQNRGSVWSEVEGEGRTAAEMYHGTPVKKCEMDEKSEKE